MPRQPIRGPGRGESPSPGGAGPARSLRGNGASYTPLFRLQIRHGYYNAGDGRCPDFSVIPTPDCARLMASLGMIFKDQGSGFTVFVDEAHVPAVLAYVSGQGVGAIAGGGAWTKLSFLLVLRNPLFVGITDLPITTDPGAQNLYVSNQSAAAVDGQLILGGSSGVGAQALQPVTGPSLAVPTPQHRVASLTDLSGAPVAAPAVAAPGSTLFNLIGLPHGRYGVAFADRAGKRLKPAAGSAPPVFLYLPDAPRSLCLIDLLLTQPVPGAGDPAAFPIRPARARGSSPAAALRPVDLVLLFRPRGTYWRYYVVSQGERGQLAGNLRISGAGTTFAKSAAALPNGDQAVLFTAATPLPLQQSPTYRFSLSGQRQGKDGSRDPISVATLPAASPAPVWPAASGDARAGDSEIYVYV
jgi:hypothetical protein